MPASGWLQNDRENILLPVSEGCGRKTGCIPKLKVEFIEALKYNYVKGKVLA